jgi:ferritin
MPELSTALCNALNKQVQKELASAYAYLIMSSHCASRNLRGTAHWLRKQWEEELSHATKLLDYVIERGSRATLGAIDTPSFKFKSLTDLFEKVLQHEREVTASIHKLYEQAGKDGDFAAQAFLQWFVTEQVEEETSAHAIVETLRMAGDTGTGLLMVDRQLGQRE